MHWSTAVSISTLFRPHFLALSFKWLRTLSLSPFVFLSHSSIFAFPPASPLPAFTKAQRRTDLPYSFSPFTLAHPSNNRAIFFFFSPNNKFESQSNLFRCPQQIQISYEFEQVKCSKRERSSDFRTADLLEYAIIIMRPTTNSANSPQLCLLRFYL